MLPQQALSVKPKHAEPASGVSSDRWGCDTRLCVRQSGILRCARSRCYPLVPWHGGTYHFSSCHVSLTYTKVPE